MKHAFTKCMMLTLLALLLAAFAAGQVGQTTGRIEGTAKDQTGGVIPGVTVTLSSVTGTKTMVTGDSGEFAFPFLTPGKFDLKAELEGFKSYEQKDILVRLGTSTTISLVLSPGEISEVVTVTGEAPLVDTTTTTVGANISDALYSSIPMRRNFTALLNLAPGVSDGGGTGSSNPSIGGASGMENNYVVDGVNITNAGYGAVGSFSNVYGSLGSGVNYDFVKEVQVKAGGFEAEYGQSLGGVINVITKSGTNDYHGGVYFYFSPPGWWASRKQINPYREAKATETMSRANYDVSFDLSGYLWKDKLFFYAGFNPQFQTIYQRAPLGYGQDINGLKLYERESRFYSWSAKATWTPFSNHNIEFSTFADPSRTSMGPNRTMTATGDLNYSALTFGSWNWIARYNGVLTNNWFFTGSLGRAYNRFEESFLHGGEYPLREYVQYFYQNYLPTHPGAAPGNYSWLVRGGPGFFENNKSTDWQVNLKTTWNLSLGGDHTFDFGYCYEDVAYTAVRRYTGGNYPLPAFRNFAGAPNGTYGASVRHLWLTGAAQDRNHDGVVDASDAVYWQIRGNYNDPNIETSTKYHSFYIQDAWKFSSHFTLKAGIRYDYQKMAGGGSAAIGYTFDGNWAPRLGLIYDVNADGKTKIYGSWGRFFEKIPNDICVRSFSSESGVNNVYWGDAALTDFLNDDLNRDIGLTGAQPTFIVPDTKSMYQDELVLGFEHELNPTLSVGARYIWRIVPRILEDLGTQTVEQYNTDSTQFVYVVANPSFASDILNNATGAMILDANGAVIGVNPDGIPDGFADVERSYNALELTLEKRFSEGMQFMANYRLSKLWGNYEGLFRNDNGQNDPNITSLFDFRLSPALMYQFVPGYLNTDRRHVFNLNGSYTFPSKFTLGLGVRLTSGAPITPLDPHPGYGNDGEIPVRPRGADGRTSWINNVDMHADYPITFGDNFRLRFAVDFFNVLNRKVAATVDENYNYVDYMTALSFQAPFNARFSMRFEF